MIKTNEIFDVTTIREKSKRGIFSLVSNIQKQTHTLLLFSPLFHSSFFDLKYRPLLPSCDMKMSVIYSVGLFFLLISLSKAHTPGTVSVDIITFDRILQKFDTVLVKFDDKYRMYLNLTNIFFN